MQLSTDPEAQRHIQRVLRGAEYGLLKGDARAARIQASWQRSIERYHLDPSCRSTPQRLSRAELAERQDELARFMSLSRGYVLQLHEQVYHSGYCVMLTDRYGAAVDFFCDESSASHFRERGLGVGTLWAEEHEGTGGVGAAITDREPILVHREDHFRVQNICISCSAAPIFAPDGDLVAVLNASCANPPDLRDSQTMVYNLVNRNAALIENAWFRDLHAHDWLLQLGSPHGVFDDARDALIAFDDSGRVTGLNRGVSQLGERLPVRLGASVGDCLDVGGEALVRLAHEQPGVAVPVSSFSTRGVGTFFLARLRAPAAQRAQRISLPSWPAGRMEPARVVTEPAGLHAASSAGRGGSGMAPPQVIACDPRMQANIARMERLVDRRIPMLILGETGAGKEVFARSVHQRSRRRDRAFVALNCAAIPENLIESELFGYRAGAFTGAKAKGDRGKIHLASGGTLFLDEIGDMPLPLQTRLLRVLAEGEILPLGASEPEKVDLNVICATHRDLAALVAQGQFREDLYYRLNAATFVLPPLRERSDCAQLIRDLFNEEARSGERTDLRLDEALVQILCAYRWPGNVRQLRNAVRYAVAVAAGPRLTLADFPPDVAGREADGSLAEAAPTPSAMLSPPSMPTPALESDEVQRLLAALRRRRWNVTAAALSLGMSRATLYRKLKRYGIVSPNAGDADDGTA